MAILNINHDNFNTNLCDGLQSILASSEMSDVTLAVEGKYFRAHQLILSMFSTYFRELFQVAPSKNPIFFMKNVKHRIMHNLLVFMYEGKVQIPSEDLPMFVGTANELKIKGLANGMNLNAFQQSIEQVAVEQSTSQVRNAEDIAHAVDSSLSLKRALQSMQPETKKCKLSENVPVQVTSEVSVLPLATSQNDLESAMDGIKLKVEVFEDEVDLVHVHPTEMQGLDDKTMKLDGHNQYNTMTMGNEEDVNDFLVAINQDPLQQPSKGIHANPALIDSTEIDNLVRPGNSPQFKRRVLTMLYGISERVQTIDKSTGIKKRKRSHLFAEPPGMPFKTIEEFNEFENGDEARHYELQEYLSQVGGMNQREALNSYFRVAMTKELAYQFTWTGKKNADGDIHCRLCDSKLMLIFFDAISSTFYGDSSNLSINSFKEDVQQVLRSYKQTWKNAVRK